MDIPTLLDKIVSHAAGLGLLDRVNTHEPKASPGNGLTAAVWLQSLAPVKGSGLASTSGRLEFNVRFYQNMMAEPQDDIDPNILRAVDALITAYSADFELGGNVRMVDLLGAYGTPLSAQAGYQNVGGPLYRVVTIVLPLIVNDIWTQEA